MGEPGVVRMWNAEEGWGVIDSPGAPGGCWTHCSHLDMEGFRALHVDQQVDLTFDDRGQDGYPYRAVRVVVPGVPLATTPKTEGASDAYGSQVTLRFDK
jgi:CspA family cold shock protein